MFYAIAPPLDRYNKNSSPILRKQIISIDIIMVYYFDGYSELTLKAKFYIDLSSAQLN